MTDKRPGIAVIDGQGGGMGRALVEQIRREYPGVLIRALGTNAIATAAMMKAGASYGATGENPAIVNSRDADIIIGPMGIVIANSLLGEITPAMSVAIGSSSAYKIFIPVNRCNHMIVGCKDTTLTEYINLVCDEVERGMAEYENRRI